MRNWEKCSRTLQLWEWTFSRSNFCESSSIRGPAVPLKQSWLQLQPVVCCFFWFRNLLTNSEAGRIKSLWQLMQQDFWVERIERFDPDRNHVQWKTFRWNQRASHTHKFIKPFGNVLALLFEDIFVFLNWNKSQFQTEQRREKLSDGIDKICPLRGGFFIRKENIFHSWCGVDPHTNNSFAREKAT